MSAATLPSARISSKTREMASKVGMKISHLFVTVAMAKKVNIVRWSCISCRVLFLVCYCLLSKLPSVNGVKVISLVVVGEETGVAI